MTGMTGAASAPAGGLCVVVLAGGEGRRIGGGKPQRQLAGQTLLARALALAGSWSAHVAIAVRHPGQAPERLSIKWHQVSNQNSPGLSNRSASSDPAKSEDARGAADVVIDDPAIDGPLSGLLASLRHGRRLGCNAVLTIPCDMPFLPPDLAGRLSAALAGTAGPAVAVASSAGRLHPVCALWTPDAEAVLLREADAGRLSLTNLTERLDRRIVDWPVTAIDPFFNINTPEDLDLAAALLTEPARRST